MVSSLLNKTFTTSLLPDFCGGRPVRGSVAADAVLSLQIIFVKVKEEPTAPHLRRVFPISGNVGFMGIPVMKALFPSDDTIILYTVISISSLTP